MNTRRVGNTPTTQRPVQYAPSAFSNHELSTASSLRPKRSFLPLLMSLSVANPAARPPPVDSVKLKSTSFAIICVNNAAVRQGSPLLDAAAATQSPTGGQHWRGRGCVASTASQTPRDGRARCYLGHRVARKVDSVGMRKSRVGGGTLARLQHSDSSGAGSAPTTGKKTLTQTGWPSNFETPAGALCGSAASSPMARHKTCVDTIVSRKCCAHQAA